MTLTTSSLLLTTPAVVSLSAFLKRRRRDK